MLDNKTSIQSKKHLATDFSFVGCKQITSLSANVDAKIQKALDNVAQHVLYGEKLEEYKGIALDDYNQILCIELNESGRENVISAINTLNSLDGVLAACPDYKMQLMSTPNDPYFEDQKAGNVDYYAMIDLYDAWDITTGSTTVRVGVIDSGIDTSHQDLNINFDLSRIFTLGTPPVVGAGDSTGHGTAVAGVIGAIGDNDIGISGVCWDVDIVSLRIFGFDEHTYSSFAMNAIDYASSDEADIDILNISACWRGDETTEPIYYDEAFNASITNFNGLVVCAAGNSEEDQQCLDVIPRYPAAYDCSNIITVGASTRYDTKYTTSNYSATYVDLFAPGDGVLTTFATNVCDDPNRHQYVQTDHYEDGYHRMCETSIATPFVTGVAALMLSVNPYLTATELKSLIMQNVDYISDLENLCVSGGRLNAHKAVVAAQNYCVHNDTYSVNNVRHHTIYCNYCDYQIIEAHDKYAAVYDNSGCSILCYKCSYRFDCDCTPNYRNINETVHWVDCPDGEFSFSEKHTFHYLFLPLNNSNRLYYHNAICNICGATYQQLHNWVAVAGGGECAECGMEGDLGFGDIMSLSDEELSLLLSSMSEEELGEFIAALPEDALARVSEILAPVNDDELLTE